MKKSSEESKPSGKDIDQGHMPDPSEGDALQFDFSDTSSADSEETSAAEDRPRTIGLDWPEAEQVAPYPSIVIFILISVTLFNVSLHILAECSTLMEEDPGGIYRFSYIIMAFSTLIGAYFSDSIYGVHKTIMFTLPFCALGSAALTVSLYWKVSFLYQPLSYIAFTCYGTVHDCFLILALNQMSLPGHRKFLLSYIIYHKFSVALGEASAKIGYLALQYTLMCFPGTPCYIGPLIATVLMCWTCLIMWIVCRMLRVIKVPHGETKLRPIRIICCIVYAIWKRFTARKVPVTHWLDRSIGKYGWHKVFESKSLLRIFLLFSIVPCFWALRYTQQSIWMNLASKMNTTAFGHIIKPTQISYLSGICYVFWTAVYRFFVYGPLALQYPLQNMILGGFMSTIGFSISGLVSFIVEMGRSSDEIPPGRGQLRFYNPTACDIFIRCIQMRKQLIDVKHMDIIAFKHLYVTETITLNITIFSYCMYNFPTNYQINITEGRGTSYIFRQGRIDYLDDDSTRGKDAVPKFRMVTNAGENDTTDVDFFHEDTEKLKTLPVQDLSSHLMTPGKYTVTAGKIKLEMFLHTGGVSVLLIDEIKELPGIYRTKFIEITRSNTVSVFLNLPQYLIVYLGDTLVHVNGARLAYIESPETLKTTFVCFWFSGQALAMIIAWLLDVITVFSTDSQNLVFISVILLVCNLIFALLCNQYDYLHSNCY